MAAANHYIAKFGHVNGILPGEVFESRMEVRKAGLMKVHQGGISWGYVDGKRYADAIVLNGGYEDDKDEWQSVLYTGEGGREKDAKSQTEDQKWESPGNDGLRNSCKVQKDVRVIRGPKGESSLSPKAGYRYDGLYRVIECTMETGRSGFLVCRFKMERLDDAQQEITSFEQQIEEIVHGAPPRREYTLQRIVRDTRVVRRVKDWHEGECQICRSWMAVDKAGRRYSEGAHIHALGRKGPDVEGNVLCLCPTCHVKFDNGALYVEDDLTIVDQTGATPANYKLKTVQHHRIEQQFIRAHRRFARLKWGQSEGG
ncbi:YDG/SRA domain-containing protein [Streptomyces sp. NPDC088925]|uniref:YDG/SRA domain-containing protein n=1 Tax=Streptomyces sp. NPDC088925 TaxID=3365914 RepID=UPI00381246A7